MTLKERLVRIIEADGPLPVSLFMQTCLHDPKHGYYATRPGLGRDFTTAPETSQIFGELIGLWIVHEWEAMWRPHPFILVEPGAGRATMMADALRAMEMTAAGRACLKSMQLYLVEPSPAMRAEQAQKLANYAPQFAVHLDDLPDFPMILVANEFLDCLPARQFVLSEDGDWHERRIGEMNGELVWGTDSETGVELKNVPEGAKEIEIQAGLESFALSLAAHVDKGQKLRALVIDYGPDDTSPRDTLRAYQDGRQVDPLQNPGMADLTVDVDFTALKREGLNAGLVVHGTVRQGPFLMALGAEARMQQLVKDNPDMADDIFARAAKLIDPAQMGERFKVMCFSSKGLTSPAGF